MTNASLMHEAGRALKAGARGQPRRMGWGGGCRMGGKHVYLWLIHDIWQKLSQY